MSTQQKPAVRHYHRKVKRNYKHSYKFSRHKSCQISGRWDANRAVAKVLNETKKNGVLI